jgi:hypothetical protein
MPDYRTKTQIQALFTCWIIDEEVPHKGREIIVVFPKGQHQDEGARIKWSPHKSDSGERLYELEFVHKFVVA